MVAARLLMMLRMTVKHDNLADDDRNRWCLANNDIDNNGNKDDDNDDGDDDDDYGWWDQ